MKIESMKSMVSAQEWQARVDLAACYRLVAHYEMSDMMANHISAAVPGEDNAFLINAYGMMYEEITASSLIKIDVDGNILAKPDFGALDYGINRAGYVIHGAIHRARHDVACVIHTHTWAGMALSALDCGVLPLTQTSMRFLRIGYHDYQGVVLDGKEEASLLADLGDGEALILRNHGLLATGATIPEAFITMYWFERACQAQVFALTTKTSLPAPETIKTTNDRYKPGQRRKIGELEWAGLLRLVERRYPGFRD